MSEVTLEQAYAVINAHYASEDARKADESRQLIGRCFKTDRADNALDESVWQCVKVTGVSKEGSPTGATFQVRLRREATLGYSAFVRYPMHGWSEISEGELRKLAAIVPASQLDEVLK